MSNLRQQLDLAKATYHRQKYPGDLAGELLPIALIDRQPAQMRHLRAFRWLVAGAAGSLAAASAITMILTSALWRPTENPAPLTPSITQFPPMRLQLPAMPEFPTDLSLVPEYQAFTLPGMPNFPSMETDIPQQNSPTTQEMVL